MPLEWLAGSPFRDYFVPSLILFVVVGGTSALAAIGVLARSHFARPGALAAGICLLVWISVQVAIIGYVSWMQPATALTGIAVVALAQALPAAHKAPGRRS